MGKASTEGRIKRAIISVSDKTGVVELARFLQEHGIEIISTGGTKQTLKDAGLKVVPVSSFTGAPEIMDGRVKTLHPKIAAGILYRRDHAEDLEQLTSLDYKPIDLVVVNLYPFQQTVASGKPEADIIENIDIGGPTLVRAAAKNFADVTILVEAAQYAGFMEEYRATGAISSERHRAYAARAFAVIAEYDVAISQYFGQAGQTTDTDLPTAVDLHLQQVSSLRYGENPHQQAALYRETTGSGLSLVDAEQLAGKELSYNNYVDLDACLGMITDFSEPFACVVKHTNPCGAACAPKLADAYAAALAADPMSAFGSIIGLNRVVDIETAHLLHDTQFVECIIAPDYAPEALELLAKKKQRRLLRLPAIGSAARQGQWLRAIHGGFLMQTADHRVVVETDLKVVSKMTPTAEQVKSLLFGFQLVKHVKSNAIAIVKGTALLGQGCGQTSRVDAVENAVKKAGTRARGAVLASDAFFPMPDGVEVAAAAGVTAIIQPGGSKNDEAAIAAADQAGIAMVVTGIRHFKH